MRRLSQHTTTLCRLVVPNLQNYDKPRRDAQGSAWVEQSADRRLSAVDFAPRLQSTSDPSAPCLTMQVVRGQLSRRAECRRADPGQAAHLSFARRPPRQSLPRPTTIPTAHATHTTCRMPGASAIVSVASNRSDLRFLCYTSRCE